MCMESHCSCVHHSGELQATFTWFDGWNFSVPFLQKTHGQERQQATRNVSKLPCVCVPWASQRSGHPISQADDVFLFGNELLAGNSLCTCSSSSASSTDMWWGHQSLWTWATAQKWDLDLCISAKDIAMGIQHVEDNSGTRRFSFTSHNVLRETQTTGLGTYIVILPRKLQKFLSATVLCAYMVIEDS